MDEWLERAAESLGERPVGRDEVGTILRLSRQVAHGVERRLAPLTAYLAGVHVGRRVAAGTEAREALREVEAALVAIIPAAPTTDRPLPQPG